MGSKSPYHAFLPGKDIGERISVGMITEWKGMLTTCCHIPTQDSVSISFGWSRSYQVGDKGGKISYWWEGQLSVYHCN